MKKTRKLPTQRRKRKYVRADEENQLVLKSKARKLKVLIMDEVVDIYLGDELKDVMMPFISLEELMERAGLDEHEASISLFRRHCHGYLKSALREVIKQGIPGVAVTLKFCNDVSEEQYETETNEKELRSWIAGLSGAGAKAEGILFVYDNDETAMIMERMARNQTVAVANGVVKRVRHQIKAAVDKRLTDSRVGQVKVVKSLPVIPKVKVDTE